MDMKLSIVRTWKSDHRAKISSQELRGARAHCSRSPPSVTARISSSRPLSRMARSFSHSRTFSRISRDALFEKVMARMLARSFFGMSGERRNWT